MISALPNIESPLLLFKADAHQAWAQLEGSDLCHTFLHYALAKKPKFMLKSSTSYRHEHRFFLAGAYCKNRAFTGNKILYTPACPCLMPNADTKDKVLAWANGDVTEVCCQCACCNSAVDEIHFQTASSCSTSSPNRILGRQSTELAGGDPWPFAPGSWVTHHYKLNWCMYLLFWHFCQPLKIFSSSNADRKECSPSLRWSRWHVGSP